MTAFGRGVRTTQCRKLADCGHACTGAVPLSAGRAPSISCRRDIAPA
jgi:hypothetical protein